MNEGGQRTFYRLADYGPVMVAAEPLQNAVILVGGQSVYIWADQYLPRCPELADFQPFTSKDADYLSDGQTAYLLASAMHSTYKPAIQKGGMRGLCLGRISFGDGIEIEMLGQIKGVKSQDVRERAVQLRWEGKNVWVIHPLHLFKAKGHNLAGIDQTNRQDGKHFSIMQWVVRCFLRDLADPRSDLEARAMIAVCEELIQFSLETVGLKLIRAGHWPEPALWPDLTAHPSPKVQKFVRLRLPQWRAKLAQALG